MARLWWMLLGNILLAFSIIFIFENRGSFFHAADGVFWITLASLVLIRYLDIRFLDGCTATGEHASITNWIRYVALLIACSTAVWVLAHVASYLLAARAAQS
jgi:hypothetical protein